MGLLVGGVMSTKSKAAQSRDFDPHDREDRALPNTKAFPIVIYAAHCWCPGGEGPFGPLSKDRVVGDRNLPFHVGCLTKASSLSMSIPWVTDWVELRK